MNKETSGEVKNPIKINIVFMGTSGFAADILDVLIKNHYNIISVYTQPEKESGRKQELGQSPVKLLAEKNKLKIFQPEKFDEETVKILQEQKPDLIIVAAYGKILPSPVLKIPGFGALNVHASLLPKFRGPSPIQNAILDGLTETGTTIMLMDEKVDTGEIISQKIVAIGKNETTPDMLKKIAAVSSELLIETLPFWIKRKITPKKQDESQASYCQLIEKTDGKIIWSDSAASIFNRFRAFYSWPGIFTFWQKNGYNLRLKLCKIKMMENAIKGDCKIGEIFFLNDEVAVQTGSGAIVLEEVQLEGKNKTAAADFVNGYPDFVGSLLS